MQSTKLRYLAMTGIVPATIALAACTSSSPDNAVSTATAAYAEAPHSPTSSSSVGATFRPHPPLDGAAASSMAADLGSGDVGRIRAQVVLPSTVQLDPTVVRELQQLQPINIDGSTFRQLNDLTAQVYAKVGVNEKEWTLIMLWENGRWMLGDSIEGRQDLSQRLTDVTNSDGASATAVTATS